MSGWRGTVRRVFTVDQLRDYVNNEVKMGDWRPSFVVVHNTDEPSKALYLNDWVKRPETKWSPLIWNDNLAAYYSGQGWKAGPHFFVLPDGRVLAFTPMNVQGTHTPSWNTRSIGVETVGDFDTETFDPITRDTLVQTLAIIHNKLGLVPEDYKLGVRGLHFHKEDPNTTHKNCPGKNVVKQDLVHWVSQAMLALNSGDHDHVSDAVSTAPAPTVAVSEAENTSIEWVQEALNRWLPKSHPELALLKVDGKITKGGKTYTAVKLFQAYHNLKLIDGVPGPLTRAALRTFT